MDTYLCVPWSTLRSARREPSGYKSLPFGEFGILRPPRVLHTPNYSEQTLACSHFPASGVVLVAATFSRVIALLPAESAAPPAAVENLRIQQQVERLLLLTRVRCAARESGRRGQTLRADQLLEVAAGACFMDRVILPAGL